MKKRNILFGIIILMYFLIPLANAIEETVYLNTPETGGEYRKIYQPTLQQGDIVYWRFTTYDDKFEVLLIIGGTTVSQGKTADSGIFNVQNDGIVQINFQNDDLEWFRSGWIDIEISINESLPEEPNISGYNLLILIFIALTFGSVIILLYCLRSKKRKIKE